MRARWKSRASIAADVSLRVWLTWLAAPRAPGAAGRVAVLFGHCIAQGLEGVAAVAEVACAVRREFEFAGLDFGAVLRVLQVAHLRRELVDAAVESSHLGVEGVHEPPEQVLSFVGELDAVRCDVLCEDAERFADRRYGLVLVPDVPGVELVAFGCDSVERGVLADDGGGGLCLVSVHGFDIEHQSVSLMKLRVKPEGPIRRKRIPAYAYWFTRAQRSHREAAATKWRTP